MLKAMGGASLGEETNEAKSGQFRKEMLEGRHEKGFQNTKWQRRSLGIYYRLSLTRQERGVAAWSK